MSETLEVAVQAVAKAFWEIKLAGGIRREILDFIAMYDALRAFDQAHREEVMPHRPNESLTIRTDNAPAPVMGADPPWLDEATEVLKTAFAASKDNDWKDGLRAVLAFANAQPPSETECKAAARVLIGRVFDHETNGIELAETLGQEVLIAVAKARIGA